MTHTYRNHQLHLIWSIKNRANLIETNIKTRLYSYIAGIVRENNGLLLEIGGTENHVHLLVSLGTLDNYSKFIRELKASSSLWVNKQHVFPTKFNWQEGYGSFSVSYSLAEAVRKYIREQDEIHKKQTFEQEYLKFLLFNEIKYEEQFVFDKGSTHRSHHFHLIWSTKHRENLIDKSFQDRLYRYIEDIVREHKGVVLEIGGIANHVHLLISLGSLDQYSEIIQKIKGSSSFWINKERFLPTRFGWQEGYGSFSVSYSLVEVVRKYIQNQEEHHKGQTFEQEYLKMLRWHGIPFDEKCVFD